MGELNAAANGIPGGFIGSYKKQVIHNIILHMPTDTATILHEAYSRLGWERSYMNEDLLRNTDWRTNEVLKAALEWKTVYTTTKETVTVFADLLNKYWISLWENDAAILEASQSEVDRRTPSKSERSERAPAGALSNASAEQPGRIAEACTSAMSLAARADAYLRCQAGVEAARAQVGLAVQ